MHKLLVNLLLLTHCSHPDIAYHVGRLSRYTHNPSVEHWDAISILLEYLKRIFYFGLSYCSYPILERYFDANWIFDTDEVKPTGEDLFTLVGEVLFEVIQVELHSEIHHGSRVRGFRED